MRKINLKKLVLLCTLVITSIGLAQQDVFVSDRGNNAINRYDIDGLFIDVFIEANSGGLSNPQDIVFHPNGNLIVSGLGNSTLKQYDGDTGAYLGDWSSGFALGAPSKMSIGPGDLVYVTQWGTTSATSKVVTFDLSDGTYQGPYTPSAPQSLGHLWDEDGNFYLALYGQGTNGVVRKYDANGAFIEDFIDSTELQGPTYIWFEEGSGDMIVQDWPEDRILRYTSGGEYVEEFITGVSRPEGIAFLESGNFLICERGANKITEFEPSGNEVGRWDSGGSLNTPNFVIIREPDLGINTIVVEAILVTPTIGNAFNFSSEMINNYSTLEIFNISGKMVKRVELSESNEWNASSLSEGLYLLVASDSAGKKATQKIVIRH